ncbi:SAM hydrolase/SAM-dependent halogenase family protein [Desulfovulcanus sp.]
MKPIVLLTDFGLEDIYVGQLKGVISRYNPQIKILDLTHHIQPFNILQGAYFLWSSYSYFPETSIFVCVVDPGVGTERRILIAKNKARLFLAPDNGLLTMLVHEHLLDKVYTVTHEEFLASKTFHGRDIFAPLAARLSLGKEAHDLGKEINPDNIYMLPHIQPEYKDQKITTTVLHTDHFGNIVLNLPIATWKSTLKQHSRLFLSTPPAQSSVLNTHSSTYPVYLAPTYAHIPTSELGLIPGSQKMYELALNQASAQQRLNLTIGQKVSLTLQR